jgi:hypothetical protein
MIREDAPAGSGRLLEQQLRRDLYLHGCNLHGRMDSCCAVTLQAAIRRRGHQIVWRAPFAGPQIFWFEG